MNVKSIEKQKNSTVELVIEVNREEFEAAINQVYKKQRSKISVPGFRKGHASLKIIEGMFGADVFYQDAINDSYPEYFEQAVNQENLEVVAWPEIQVLSSGKDGYSFKAVVTISPEVTLGEYKGLTAEKKTVKITDEDIEGEMKPYIDRATRTVTVDREAKMGDVVVLDYTGLLNGEPFEGGTGDNQNLELGSGMFVPGFEEQLVGTKAGDQKDVNITFPEDYHADLAGKDVVFKVKVTEVKEKQLPTLDDEFAKDVSEFDTLDEFKKDLGKQLKERRENANQQEFEQSLLETAADNMTVDIPDPMVDFQAEQIIREVAENINAQGIPFEQYMMITGMTPEGLKEHARESAMTRVRRDLLLGAVVKAENIEATDDEVEADYKKFAEQHGIPVEKVKENLAVEDVRKQLTMQKAARLIIDSGKAGKAKKASTKKKADSTESAEKPKKKTAAKKKTDASDTAEKPKKAAKKEKEEE